MYEITFYETAKGESDIRDLLEELRIKSDKGNKDARIQLNQIAFCIERLQIDGPLLRKNTKLTKHIDGDIWELRPGRNRVFYFYFHQDGSFVLLHHFLKQTQKTPAKEIIRARREMEDHIARKGDR